MAMAEENTLDELRALGHLPMTPMQAIRAHCIDCAGGSASEVAKCAARKCPSWPFRFGHNPWRPPPSEARLAAMQERGRRLAANWPGKSAEADKALTSSGGSPTGDI
jgi:hypothetical protein